MIIMTTNPSVSSFLPPSGDDAAATAAELPLEEAAAEVQTRRTGSINDVRALLNLRVKEWSVRARKKVRATHLFAEAKGERGARTCATVLCWGSFVCN